MSPSALSTGEDELLRSQTLLQRELRWDETLKNAKVATGSDTRTVLDVIEVESSFGFSFDR